MTTNRNLRAAGVAALLLATLSLPAQAHESGQHGRGHGMMGEPAEGCPQQAMPGRGMMGQGYGMGPGMMGPGQGMMGQGMMGQGMMGGGTMGPGMMMGPATDRDLSADDVRQILEGRLAWIRNPNLKLGSVEASDEDTVVAEIVTQEGSLVQTLAVDRRSGMMRPAP